MTIKEIKEKGLKIFYALVDDDYYDNEIYYGRFETLKEARKAARITMEEDEEVRLFILKFIFDDKVKKYRLVKDNYSL